MYVSVVQDPYRIVRLVAFFVAGVVVAVGAALIYSIQSRSPGTKLEMKMARENVAPEIAASAPVPEAVDLDQSGVPRRVFEPAETVVTAPQDSVSHSTAHPSSTAPAGRRADPVLPPPPIGPDEFQLTEVERAAAAAIDANVPAPAPYTTPVPSHQLRQATFEAGTPVAIRLGEMLSTALDHRGESFRATLDAPLIANGRVIAGRGAAVVGRLLAVHRARLIGGASEMRLVLTGINTSDGQFLAIDTFAWDGKGGRIVLGNPAKLAVGAVAEVVSGAAKVTHVEGSDAKLDKIGSQKSVTLPKGTRLTFRLSIPVTIAEKIASR